jgi:hypothetical protein
VAFWPLFGTDRIKMAAQTKSYEWTNLREAKHQIDKLDPEFFWLFSV